MTLQPLGQRHRQGHLDRERDAARVVRIHLQRARELAGRARERREDQHARILRILRGDELLRHEVHAVAHRRDQPDLGCAEKAHEHVVREVAVQIADRRPVGFREPPVDASGRLLELAPDPRIGAQVGARQRCDLQIGDAAEVVGMGLQEALVGAEAAGQALAVVEPVDADHQPPAEQSGDHASHVFAALRFHGLALDRIDVDADRVGVQHHAPLACAHRAVRQQRFGAVQLQHGRAEGVDVGLRLEAEHVVGQHRIHELAVDRQHAQRLDVREGHVQEERGRLLCPLFAQRARQRDQVEIVHPQQVVVAQQRPQRRGEAAVHLQVAGIVLVGEVHRLEKIVERRPERAVAEAVQEVRELGFLEIDGRERDAVARDDLRLLALARADLAAPAEPQSAACLHGREHADGEAARRGAAAGDGDTVRNGDDSAHLASSQGRLRRVAHWMMPTRL